MYELSDKVGNLFNDYTFRLRMLTYIFRSQWKTVFYIKGVFVLKTLKTHSFVFHSHLKSLKRFSTLPHFSLNHECSAELVKALYITQLAQCPSKITGLFTYGLLLLLDRRVSLHFLPRFNVSLCGSLCQQSDHNICVLHDNVAHASFIKDLQIKHRNII